MIEFIFMLTHNDRTVADARAVYDEIRSTACATSASRTSACRSPDCARWPRRSARDGREVMLEVVSEDAGRRAALDPRRPRDRGRLAARRHPPGRGRSRSSPGTPVRYCPFPGRVIGHPSLLRGTIDEIADDAAGLTARPGVHGLDLLAYRYDGDVEALTAAVNDASAVAR